MATFDYAEMQAVANELIEEFGQAGSIISMSAPDELAGGDPVTAAHDCRVVTMAYDARYLNGSTILAGDVQIYISALGLDLVPQVGMSVTVGGKSYLIVSMDPNQFDGQTPVVYVATGRTAS